MSRAASGSQYNRYKYILFPQHHDHAVSNQILLLPVYGRWFWLIGLTFNSSWLQLAWSGGCTTLSRHGRLCGQNKLLLQGRIAVSGEKLLLLKCSIKFVVLTISRVADSAANRSIGSTISCTITEKAPTRAFSWLKAPTSAFTFKTLLKHYAKRALTPRSLNVKLGPRRNYHQKLAPIRHYANQPARPLWLLRRRPNFTSTYCGGQRPFSIVF